MKNKRTKVDNSDSIKIPQSTLQAVFSLLWPLNNWLKKIMSVVVIVLVAFFSIWVSLPEKTKMEILDYLKGSKKTQSPTITTNEKVPSVNIKKEIRQHTEGDQSPAVVSNGDVNINIGRKDSKK